MKALTPLLRRPISSFEEAKAWIRELETERMSFHFEDDPFDIVDGHRGGRLFSDEDASIVVEQLRRLYAFDWGAYECPIGYHMDTFEPGWRD